MGTEANAKRARGADPLENQRFATITSPLAENGALERELTRCAPMGPCEDEPGELADFLSIAAEAGRIDRWDFYGRYLTGERIPALYDLNIQLQFDANMRDDVGLMLEDIAAAERGDPGVTDVDLGNLATILRHVDDPLAMSALERVRRLRGPAASSAGNPR